MSLTYLESVVVGAFQGFSELFPISSLGHSVLIPALVGGRWARDLSVSAPESPYLAFIVGLHVATAAALLVFFWRDWVAIIGGFFTSIRRRSLADPYQRLAWLIIIATIPVGLAGLALEHLFRTTLGKPVPAAAFLVVNGLVLLAGERLRRRAPVAVLAGQTEAVAAGGLTMGDVAAERRAAREAGQDVHSGPVADGRLAGLSVRSALAVGSAQILALLPGISRSGSAMVAGLFRGLSHEDAARFSFLLATPVILAAGVLKIPDLFGPLGAGIHGQVLVGSIASFVTAYLSVRYLTRYFRTRTLTPFAIYSIALGAGALVWLAVH
ncbi:undecaprenyl-diphosphate phosphatase [Isoptericola sp. b441]|uniref:Undecaprenyl-diphosphatase n=1 Tax=Actinotalea lenta TaxID=3064654 RepID=A0ABT9DCX7_9CELL|nr:undecaprenyl-diphosphate phosphatase [Isoptericola sp. b441]MDO8108381.1 undecaprenyl-diphosphate phosphatase [Isoptericola sp. b441]